MASEPVILNVYDMVSICVVLDGWSHILFWLYKWDKQGVVNSAHKKNKPKSFYSLPIANIARDSEVQNG
jgi:hypothetical protein